MPVIFCVSAMAQIPATRIYDGTALASVKKNLNAKEYAAAYKRLLEEADEAMAFKPVSVMDKEMLPPSGDKHDYVSMGPYWWPDPTKPDGLPYIRKDGERNPNVAKDRSNIGITTKNLLTLGTAYYFSDDEKYAAKAAEIAYVWFLNPETRMNPNMNYGQMVPGHRDGQGRGFGMIDAYSFTELVDVMEMLSGSESFTEAHLEGMRQWFRDYLEWIRTSPVANEERHAENNHGLAFDVQVVSYALFTGDTELAMKTIGEFAEKRLFPQIEPDGKQPRELARTTGLGYTNFNISHMLDMCAICKSLGIDMYDVTSSDGRNIAKAIDYMASWIDKPQSQFPYQQIKNWEKEQQSSCKLLRRASLYDSNPQWAAKVKKYMKADPKDRSNLLFSLPASRLAPVRIACVGNSITAGVGVKNREKDSYPMLLGQMFGQRYEIGNFGVSGRTMIPMDRSYMKEKAYRNALGFKPDILIIKLGTNDSNPKYWEHKELFAPSMTEMVNEFRKQSPDVKVYICYPIAICTDRFQNREKTLVEEVIPALDRLAAELDATIIDLHTPTVGKPGYYMDALHPNEAGALVMADAIYSALTGRTSGHDFQPFPGIRSEWYGCGRYDFRYKNRKTTVVRPENPLEGNPWIWRPAFFGAFPETDAALLRMGFHIVYHDLAHQYGCPKSIKYGDDFYRYMTEKYGLSPKVTIEGLSRGGYYALNWAIANPEKVACLYLDNPVCDMFSWPGRGREKEWKDFLKLWGLQDAAPETFHGNPIENLEPLAANKVPIIVVCGDKDTVVPFEENIRPLSEKYRSLGGPIEMIVKPGADHHPHGLKKPEPVVDFIVRNQPDYQKKQYIRQRESISNSYIRFTKDKKGTVAFLGGSITEMKGWRNMIKEDLVQRFPETEFKFIEVGIPSTGSTPHAFRLENDVLKAGIPDLMFVEAAVNDDVNRFNAEQQVRGMEGIIRHARKANPDMDMIMLHFIHDKFIGTLDSGSQPEVILNHERVAEHYSIPSINLAEEVALRMRDGEFDWKYFGGIHPSWNGHKYYAAAINRLFDMEWTGEMPKKIRHHKMPKTQLDAYSYTKGKFVDIRSANKLEGWEIVEDWTPSVKANTRKGFVNVPMLTTETAGSTLELDFKGRAIGIFCAAGPQACVLEYSIDGAPFKSVDTFTSWSKRLYLPWVYMFGTELSHGRHTLKLRVKDGPRTGCQIRNFVVNE